MSRLRWFKHYNDAHEGQTIAQLWAEPGGGEVVGFYWTILEMVSRWEDQEKRGSWCANLSIFKSKLGMNRQKSRKLLQKISETFQMKVFWKSDESFELFVPKWLELQETRGGKREAKIEQSAGRREKREGRRENNTTMSAKEPDGVSSVSEADEGEFNLEAIYEAYPRRKGDQRKQLGLKRLKAIIKTDDDFHLAMRSVKGYKAHLMSQNKVGTEFVKMFASFWDSLGDWKSWAEKEQRKSGAEITDDLIIKAFGYIPGGVDA
jgi:heme-degrading monooxygenase HmoA